MTSSSNRPAGYGERDCPACLGRGDQLAGTIRRAGRISRLTKKCRRCRGTGLN